MLDTNPIIYISYLQKTFENTQSDQRGPKAYSNLSFHHKWVELGNHRFFIFFSLPIPNDPCPGGPCWNSGWSMMVHVMQLLSKNGMWNGLKIYEVTGTPLFLKSHFTIYIYKFSTQFWDDNYINLYRLSGSLVWLSPRWPCCSLSSAMGPPQMPRSSLMSSSKAHIWWVLYIHCVWFYTMFFFSIVFFGGGMIPAAMAYLN